MPRFVLHEVKRISTHGSYHGWPTVARLASGELLVVVSAGRERHVCPFGQVHLIRSSDGGRTWSPPEILANGPLDDRDAGVMQTAEGTVLVNWFTSVAWLARLAKAEAQGPEGLAELGEGFAARCQKIRSLLSDEVVSRELGTWILRSTDGGRTWSAKIDCGVGSPHGPTQLADGRLLFVGNLKADPVVPGAGSAYSPVLGAAESRDDGRTWRRLGEIPHRPGDPVGSYDEPHAVQAPDGRIIVHIRHDHGERDKGFILQSDSSDGGRTFSEPRSTGLWGYPAHLLALPGGRLLTTYGYRMQPSGNRAAVSEDGGRTWSEPIVLDEKPVGRDLGYPSSAELEDGSLLSVWYEKMPDDAMASLQAAHWSLK